MQQLSLTLNIVKTYVSSEKIRNTNEKLTNFWVWTVSTLVLAAVSLKEIDSFLVTILTLSGDIFF